MIIKDLVNKSHSNSSDLVNNFLLSVYQWRDDIQTAIDNESQNWELKLIYWWLTEGREGYPNCDVSVGLSSDFMLHHVYSFQAGYSNTTCLAPFTNMIDVCIESNLSIGSKEFNEWMYRWAYPSILKSNSKIEKVFVGRMLFWAYENEGERISSESIETFEQFVITIGIEPKEGFRSYADKFKHLVNIFGEPALEIGIGIDARLIKKVFDNADIISEYFDKTFEDSYAPINVFATPAPSAMVYLGGLENSLAVGLSVNILSSPSEHKDWPACNEFLLDYFDEVWLHSEFVYQSLPASIRKEKARVVPLPVSILGTPDKNTSSHFFDKYHNIYSKPSYKFIISFDLCSSVSRKNPYAAIDAFLLAFEECCSDVSLIVKLNNGDLRPELAKELEVYCSQSSNIYVINERVSFDELLALYSSIDCYISLHRSEGFGRNIAEMMLLKKPVIVTAFSGNLDFNDHLNSWLVPYELVSMKPDEYLYSKNQFWANADLNVAAKLMQEVFNSNDTEVKVNNAYETIAKNYSIETCAKKYRNILESFI
ncbi:glycosyltransferase [Vibrio maerlii]|uniref:glycosyltransferase n=1 Tax=Vibrio maerlii TaxID=2231648 RepID=UPI000E3C003A|nr:glycosyltransferase [Vibrio maerlii]